MTNKTPFSSIPFIIGILCGLKINIIGEVYVGEIIAIVYLILRMTKVQITKFEFNIILLAFLWAFVQTISDVVNETPIDTMLKGVGTPIVFASSILALVDYFKNNTTRAPAFFLGASLGFLIYTIISGNDYFTGNPWKWGLGHFIVVLFTTIFSYYLRSQSKIVLGVFTVAFVSACMLFSSRSMALFILMASFLCYQYSIQKKKSLFFLMADSKFGFSFLCVFIIGALFVLNSVFGAIFTSEYFLENLSQEDAYQYQVQASGEYGVLLGGRAELLISSKAFMDKPLLGHGSWAEDKSGYLDEYSWLVYNLGYSLNDSDSYTGESNLIPTHSYIMGALVWSGIFGGLIWIYLFRFLVITYAKFYNDSNLLLNYLTVLNIWNIFFSPFGADARWFTAMSVAIIYAALYFRVEEEYK